MEKIETTGRALAKERSVSPTARKWMKLMHVIFSASWFGGNLSLILLNFMTPRPDTAAALVLQNVIFHSIATTIVATASILSFLGGLLLCWKSSWGFFRHRWVFVKIIVTLVVIVFCATISGPAIEETIELSRALGMEALHNEAYLANAMLSAVVQPAIFAILVFLAYLSIFKPWSKRKSAQ